MIIVMGVSGSGKTTVGQQLAHELGLLFFDADDFHPASNIEKMKSGIPLTDADRFPWLEKLAAAMDSWEQQGGAVLACSALKETYRKILSKQLAVEWVCLSADFETIHSRMQQRDHYMKADMLKSQFDALEVPSYGIHIDASQQLDVMLSEIKKQLTHE